MAICWIYDEENIFSRICAASIRCWYLFRSANVLSWRVSIKLHLVESRIQLGLC